MKIKVKYVLYGAGMLVAAVLILLIIKEIILFPEQIVSSIGETTAEETIASSEVKTEDAEETESSLSTSKKKQKDYSEAVDGIIAEMNLSEKICQMFILTPEQLVDDAVDPVVAAGQITSDALANYPVGGIVYFAKNLVNREQTTEMLSNIQSFSKIPLFLCVDEEGGSVSRIAKNPSFGTTVFDDMGTISTVEEAENVGRTIGKELRGLGFNLDFAPVADVNSNPNNPVIGARAFSDDPEIAASMVSACVKGFKKSEMMCTLKHFPGHGDTEEDSHTSMATTEKKLEELNTCEFMPFVSGISSGADMVMAGHITCIAIDDLPASLSEVVINGILRGQLGFDGPVVTDAMNMGAIAERYTSGEACVMAVKAGCDLILMPNNFPNAYDALVKAVENGVIQEQRIDQSVKRILMTKIEGGIYDIME